LPRVLRGGRRGSSLVNALGRFDLDVLVNARHPLASCVLLIGDQVRVGVGVGVGVQDPPSPLEQIGCPAADAAEPLLHPASTPPQCVAGEADHLHWAHREYCGGESFRRGGLEAAEPVRGNVFRPLIIMIMSCCGGTVPYPAPGPVPGPVPARRPWVLATPSKRASPLTNIVTLDRSSRQRHPRR
jgi:hypothetical protein